MRKKKKTDGDLALFIDLKEEVYIIRKDKEGKLSLFPTSANIIVIPELLKDRGYFAKASEEHINALREEYAKNGEELPDISPLFSVKIVDDIPGIDKEKSILDFTDEEIQRVLEFYFGDFFEIRESPPSAYYKASRRIAHLQTRPRKKGGDLYDILSLEEEGKRKEEHIKFAKESEKDKSLSTLTSGLILNPIEYKVVKAIQKHLYLQSKGYDRGDVGGVPPWTLKGINADNRRSYVVLYPTQLTKEVLGREEIGGKDLARVREAIQSLDKKIIYDDEAKGYLRLLTIEKVGDGYIVLSLREVFTKEIEKNFINSRTDELKLLSGINSSTTLRLYDLILIMDSYNPPTLQKDGYIEFMRDGILDRVAVQKSYDKNPKRREEDFKTALEELKGIGLISRYEDKGNKVRIYPNKEWKKGAGGES